MNTNNSTKERLDVLMVIRGLAESREQAKRLILSGAVEIERINFPKPGLMVNSEIIITVKAKEKYVSRGGLKLEAALKTFHISLNDIVCMDVGASTGGFTDCMLQHGARQVYSVDVGASQMHERVRSDGRVTLLEHTNARNLTADAVPVQPQFAAVDVSFISILRITQPLRAILAPEGNAVLLIKPQFEAGREAVSRGRGVIRNRSIHREVIVRVLDELSSQGWQVRGLTPSPITGGSGNIEFLCWAGIGNVDYAQPHAYFDIDEVILSAGAPLK